MSPRTRILLAGYFGAGNLGDEAILGATLVQLSTALGDELCPTIAAYDHNAVRAYHGPLDTVDVWDVRALAATVASSSLVIWGGGGLLQDHWQVPVEDLLLDARGGVPAHLRVPLLAELKGVPCMMYGQGVGPLSHPESRRATALVCDRLSAITVRDQASAHLLRDCGVTHAPIAVTADPALATVPAEPSVAHSILGQAGLGLACRPRLIVAPRLPPDGSRAWIEPLVAALRATVLDRGGAVAFIAFDHRPEGDEPLCRELAVLCGGAPSAVAITSWLGAGECAGVLATADTVVATRLHALVLAAVAGTAAVALDYDPKVRAFASELGGAVPTLPLANLAALPLGDAINGSLAAAVERRAVVVEAVCALRARETGNLRTALWLLGREERPELGPGASAAMPAERPDREAELAEVQRQLTMLRSSRVVRLVERYWRWLGRVRQQRQEAGSAVSGSRQSRMPHRPSAPAHEAPVPEPTTGQPLETTASDPWAGIPEIELAAHDRGAAGVAIVLSGTKLIDSEGQRPMHLALTLARKGFAVVFGYWRWSANDWCPQDRLTQGVFQVPLDILSASKEMVFNRFAWCEHRLLMVEFPHPSFVPVMEEARARGWTVVYDVLDDWAEFHRVGQAMWFDEVAERRVVELATLVTAVTPALEHRLRRLGAATVTVVPNGLRPDIATVRAPVELARGEVTVGYFGYLASAWFDWELLVATARSRPSWRLYVIGYGGEPDDAQLPDNLVLLGKQPQSELAAFAAGWDVAIVPFRPEALAAGADPIKTYEYLAMGLPVVVTGVFPPAGAEAFVERVEGLAAFLEALERAAARPAAEIARRREWAAAHTWDSRLDSIFEAFSATRATAARS